MARYRKIDVLIWDDQHFQALNTQQQLKTIKDIVFDRADAYFQKFYGPYSRVADSPKRRPDLSSSIWKSLRREMLKEHGTACHYCHKSCAADPTIDHVIAVTNGGNKFEKDNLVVSCRSCNSKKGSKEGWEVYRHV